MTLYKKRYYKFSDYLKKRFGCRVRRISVDAGFACPNKDGTLSSSGCIYCDNNSFSRNSRDNQISLDEQIKEGISAGIKKNGSKYILYFQANTNTHAPVNELREKYDIIKKHEEFIMLAIATRPDFITEEILNIIEGYTDKYEVWLELGLQSMHDKTLAAINRSHTYGQFLTAYEMIRKYKNIKCCVHVIIGLPGENEQDISATADEIGRLKADGIKIHPLYVVKGTTMEKLLREGRYEPLAADKYISLAVSYLERLSPETVIQRLTADCPSDMLVSPEWINNKQEIIRGIEQEMEKRKTFQGRRYKG